MQKKKIIKIDSVAQDTSKKSNGGAKKRVAAYARVSTEREEQSLSYETQIEYYTAYIKNNPEWEFVTVYSDEGISGTGTKNRHGFSQMISDALNGQIDLILTKSVSRFARNTLDSISTIRRLKECGVECFFEKENLSSFDMKGEFMLTLMSSFAQEESRSISENIKWSKRKRFAEGKYGLAYSRFLGYTKGEDTLEIVPEEVEVIKLIYQRFLLGYSNAQIKQELELKGYPTPYNLKKWCVSTIRNILKNEKYYGAALLQKTYTEDFLVGKSKKNNGELPKYYIPNDHAPIISRQVHELVQAEFDYRSDHRAENSRTHLFSNKVFCADCGGAYTPRYISAYDLKYKKISWMCKNHYFKQTQCETWRVDESVLIESVNIALREKMTSESILEKTIDIVGKSIKDGKRYGSVSDRTEKMKESFLATKINIDEDTIRVTVKRITVYRDSTLILELLDGSCYRFKTPAPYECLAGLRFIGKI